MPLAEGQNLRSNRLHLCDHRDVPIDPPCPVSRRVGQRVCLARTGARNDEQRDSTGATAMLDGLPLLRIELFEIRNRCHQPHAQHGIAEQPLLSGKEQRRTNNLRATLMCRTRNRRYCISGLRGRGLRPLTTARANRCRRIVCSALARVSIDINPKGSLAVAAKAV